MRKAKTVQKKGTYNNKGVGNIYLQNEIIKILKAYENALPIYVFMEELDRAKTTIHDNLRRLKEKGILYITREYNGKKGRPMTLWNLMEEDLG